MEGACGIFVYGVPWKTAGIVFLLRGTEELERWSQNPLAARGAIHSHVGGLEAWLYSLATYKQ